MGRRFRKGAAVGFPEWAWAKLPAGGLVIFDDYGFHSCTGVTKLANSLKGDSDKRIVHNLNGHAIIVKL